MRGIITSILFFLVTTGLFAQNKLLFHTESVDSLLAWMQKDCPKNNVSKLTYQAGNQLMEQLLKDKEKDVIPFGEALKGFNYKDSTSGSAYLLNDAYKYRSNIKELLVKIRSSDFSAEVYKRVIKYFSTEYIPPRNYEVFFTATGWKWGDAMTFTYANENGKYTVADKGTPAIIFNLTLVCSTYGNTTSEQIAALEDVMSHELFHALLADYIKSSWPLWSNENISNNALFLMLNEGIAHYISDGKLLRDGYNKDDKLKQKEKEAFGMLADSAKVIFNTGKKDEERNNALSSGLYGKYWKKYICISGLFMAYHIEEHYGTQGLSDCVKNGPLYFIKKYNDLCKSNKGLPALPEDIIRMKKLKEN